jgi:hypothetical protein
MLLVNPHISPNDLFCWRSAACAVGVAVVGIYLSISIRERFLGRAQRQRVAQSGNDLALTTIEEAPIGVEAWASPAASAAPLPIEETIDALLAGRISRVEAIARLEALLKSQVNHMRPSG